MKIAVVSGDDFSDDDPSQLCAALAARGHAVTAYVRQRDGVPAEGSAHPTYQSVPVRIGPRAVQSAREVLPFVGDWAAVLERHWSADQPEVVHAYGWLGGLAAQLAARRQRLPTVQSFHGLAMLLRSRFTGGAHTEIERRRIEPLLARNADWLTLESNADVDALAPLRRSRARLSVLTSGVDVGRYNAVGPALARTDLRRVLCLAPNPLPCNGFDIAIRVLTAVPGAELIVAETDATERAHDRARAQLKRLATELKVADRVSFLCSVAEDELPLLLRSTDVVVCTPRQPPRASVVLRAMATGVAVVTWPIGVLADAVVDTVTGVVVSTGSLGELAAALRSLLAQRFQCQSMGAAGRSRALSRFTWDRVAVESLTIYQTLSPQPLSSPLPPSTGAGQPV